MGFCIGIELIKRPDGLGRGYTFVLRANPVVDVANVLVSNKSISTEQKRKLTLAAEMWRYRISSVMSFTGFVDISLAFFL